MILHMLRRMWECQVKEGELWAQRETRKQTMI